MKIKNQILLLGTGALLRILLTVIGAFLVFQSTLSVKADDTDSETTSHNSGFWRKTGESYSSDIYLNNSSSVWSSSGKIEVVDGNDTLAVDPADFVLIGKELRAINDDIQTVSDTMQTQSEEVSELKKSVSDGKSSIASAITAQGVATEADATFDTMASHISEIGTKRYNKGYSAGVADSSPHIVNLGSFYLSSGETKGTYTQSFSIPTTAQGKTHYVYAIITSGGYNSGRGTGEGGFSSATASSNGTTATVSVYLNPGVNGGADAHAAGYCICIY